MASAWTERDEQFTFTMFPIRFLAPPTSLPLELRRKGYARFMTGSQDMLVPHPSFRTVNQVSATLRLVCVVRFFCNLHMVELSGAVSFEFHAIYFQLPRLARVVDL